MDEKRIKSMPRRELNAEVLHCWREQAEMAAVIQALERQRAARNVTVEELERENAAMREALSLLGEWARNDIAMRGGGGQYVGNARFASLQAAREVRALVNATIGGTPHER